MDKKTLVVGALIALVIALGVTYFAPTPSVVREIIKEQFGALTGPDITSEYLCVNGVCTYYYNGACADATTTVISIQNPFRPATSTVYVDRLDGQIGTSSVVLSAGTSSYNSVNLQTVTAGSEDLNLFSVNVSTSTHFSLIGSNAPGAQTATSVGTFGIQIASSTYFMVVATGTTLEGTTPGSDNDRAAGAIAGTANLFSCTYSIRIVR